MPKSTTSSFITELPVLTGSYEEFILKKRFFAAKQQYNALLGEALKRLERMRKDERYGDARELYKQEGKKKRQKLFSISSQKNMSTASMRSRSIASNGLILL